MSTENSLPSELAAFEARLRKQPLDRVEIDRDELMYQAGWAAAEAARKMRWLWPTTSGVLAASVLVLATFLLNGPEEPPMTTIAEVAPPKIEVTVPAPVDETPIVSHPTRYPSRWAQPRWTQRSPFLAMRDRALRMEFDEPASFAGPASFVEIDDDYAPKAVTARELMQEFLGETS